MSIAVTTFGGLVLVSPASEAPSFWKASDTRWLASAIPPMPQKRSAIRMFISLPCANVAIAMVGEAAYDEVGMAIDGGTAALRWKCSLQKGK